MNPLQYKAVLFDFDGTLYDKSKMGVMLVLHNPSRALWLKANQHTRSVMKGKECNDRTHFYEVYFEALQHSIGKKSITLGQARRWYFSSFLPLMIRVLRLHYKAYPGITEMVESIHKAGGRACIFSDYPCIDERLGALGIECDFDLKISAEDAGALKPATRPFLEIAKQLNLAPSEILMIGDRLDTDGEGALNVGMAFIRIVKKHKKDRATPYDMTWRELMNAFRER